ncbi:MAG: CARDB domain-containing protein [Candidatus Zixiibacteriota bacterium]
MMRRNYIFCFLAFISLTFGQVMLSPIPQHAPLVETGDSPFRTGGNKLIANPGLLPAYYQSQIYARYEKMYWGIDNLSEASLAANYSLTNMAAGMTMNTFSQNMMTETTIRMMYGQRIGQASSIMREENKLGTFAGIMTTIHLRAYNQDNFQLEDPDDPLLSDGLSKFNISAGIGLFMREEWGELFMAATELNQPNMALDEDVQDRIPMSIQMGSNIPVFDKMLLSPLVSWHPVYEDMAKDFSASLAMSYIVTDGITVRFGGGNDELSFKGSYQFEERKGLFVTYEAEYPLHGIQNTSHKFGVGYRLEPPPPLYPDLVIKEINIEGTPIPAKENKILIQVKNKGRRPASGYKIAVFIDGKLYETIDGNKTDAGGDSYANIVWTPDEEGDFRIVARVDDDGTTYPKYNGDILELDEENNEASTQRKIFGKPSLDIDVEKKQFRLTQLISITEDEPMIPLVFFEKYSSEIDSRFEQMLRVVAKRISRNPNATLVIYGYYSSDEEMGQELAEKRANNIRNWLVNFDPELDYRVFISRSHQYDKPRAVKEKFQGTRDGRIYTAQENRRAKIDVQSKSEFSKSFNNIEDITEQEIQKAREILEHNPDYDLILQGDNLEECIDKEKLLLSRLGNKYKDKIFSQTTDNFENGNCKLTAIASGIIFKPIRRMSKADDYIIDKEWDEAFINLKPKSETDIQQFEVEIHDMNGNIVQSKTLSGDKRSKSWNWRDRTGKYASPEESFTVHAELIDQYGQKARAISDTLEVVVKNKSDVKEKLILSQFTFAGAKSEIDYGASRVEYLARRLIDMIEDESGGKILVSGHTDVVGVANSHLRLSNERAQEQGRLFRKYLRHILDLPTDEALTDWFKRNNFDFVMKGFGSQRPYTITRRQDGFEKEITIGDNEKPEGRIANRRVEIEFIPSGAN